MRTISASINGARDSALRHRDEMWVDRGGEHQGRGTNHWQAANVDPFQNAAEQVQTLLGEADFVEQVQASTRVIPEGTKAEAVERLTRDHAFTVGQVDRTLKRGVDELLTQEAEGGRSCELGRYAIDFDRSPFKSV